MASAISEIAGFILSGVLYSKLGPKLIFVFSNGIAALGGIAILFYGLKHQDNWTLPVLILFSKFGISCSVNTLFIAHNHIFPLLFSATSLGIVNVLSRTASAASPLFDIFEEPVPMVVFTVTTGITCLLSFFL